MESPETLPTCAAPGTAAKLKVLTARAAARVDLFHPGDADRIDGETPDMLLVFLARVQCGRCTRPAKAGRALCPHCTEQQRAKRRAKKVAK